MTQLCGKYLRIFHSCVSGSGSCRVWSLSQEAQCWAGDILVGMPADCKTCTHKIWTTQGCQFAELHVFRRWEEIWVHGENLRGHQGMVGTRDMHGGAGFTPTALETWWPQCHPPGNHSACFKHQLLMCWKPMDRGLCMRAARPNSSTAINSIFQTTLLNCQNMSQQASVSFTNRADFQQNLLRTDFPNDCNSWLSDMEGRSALIDSRNHSGTWIKERWRSQAPYGEISGNRALRCERRRLIPAAPRILATISSLGTVKHTRSAWKLRLTVGYLQNVLVYQMAEGNVQLHTSQTHHWFLFRKLFQRWTLINQELINGYLLLNLQKKNQYHFTIGLPFATFKWC